MYTRVELRQKREITHKAMEAIVDRAQREGRSLNANEVAEFDSLEAHAQSLAAMTPVEDRQQPAGSEAVRAVAETRGVGGSAPRVGRGDYLSCEQRYGDWLNEKLRTGGLTDRRSVATDFDHSKYWRGMVFGDWKGADAEQRASMQEGVSADGGYLVPVPVAGQWVDLLRDNIVFLQGNAHTVPWDSGSTLTLPVMVTDPVVQNPNEGADIYPPSSDATVNRYSVRCPALFSAQRPSAGSC